MTTASEDRILVLLRHAKAERGGLAEDHERQLTPRGRKDAAAAGHWLVEHGIGLDEVICSTSTRTQQTAEQLWGAGCPEAEVHFDRRVYNASPDALLEVIRESDPEASVVMVVGHAPGIPALASMLADGEGSGEAHQLMSRGFPTSGMAVLRYSGHWADLGECAALLERFHVARG